VQQYSAIYPMHCAFHILPISAPSLPENRT